MHSTGNELTTETALLAYDTLLTLSDEIEYIWQKTYKLGKVLYLLARYPTLPLVLLAALAHFWKTSLQVRVDIV